MSKVGVGLVKLQSHSFALDHLLSEGGCLLAVVLNGFAWVLGFWRVHSNETDSLFVLQDEGVTVYYSPDGAVLSLAFFKWVG